MDAIGNHVVRCGHTTTEILPLCIYLAERAKKTKEYKGFTNSRNSIIVRIGLTNVSWVNRRRVESKEVSRIGFSR